MLHALCYVFSSCLRTFYLGCRPKSHQSAEPHGLRLARPGRGMQQPGFSPRNRAPDLFLKLEGLPAALGEPVLGLAFHEGSSADSVCRESASVICLSSRHHSMRGKRTAMPLLWRGLRAMPSNPSSNTSVGLTLRTGPKVSIVVLRTTASTRPISASVRPE